MWITRLKENHMVKKDHVKGKVPVGIKPANDEELAHSRDGIHWDDTGEEIVWETDTIQEYHMIPDPSKIPESEPIPMIPDPNFKVKPVPPKRPPKEPVDDPSLGV